MPQIFCDSLLVVGYRKRFLDDKIPFVDCGIEQKPMCSSMKTLPHQHMLYCLIGKKVTMFGMLFLDSAGQ